MSISADSMDELINLSYSSHERLSKFHRLVYPVISRRSGGLSLGINLNPDKACTFSCVYCQVNRFEHISLPTLDLDQIYCELEGWIKKIIKKGNCYKGHPLKDIAIAGDGEPTMVKELGKLIGLLVDLKKKYPLDQCKLVLFTNGTHVHNEQLQTQLPSFFENKGEIWFKLDYWDESSLQRINRARSSYTHLINNLKRVGLKYPLVLQSCFFSWQGESLTPSHYKKYRDLIKYIIGEGVQIKLIQVYTLARKPTEDRAKPWKNEEMREISSYLKRSLNIPIKIYGEKGGG